MQGGRLEDPMLEKGLCVDLIHPAKFGGSGHRVCLIATHSKQDQLGEDSAEDSEEAMLEKV